MWPPSEKVGQSLNIEHIESFMNERPSNPDYLSILDGPHRDINPAILSTVNDYYRRSLEYVADQIERFLDQLQQQNLLEESLVVIIGGHGEEFLERKFMLHTTLYDANIRPGLIVKPPSNSDLDVPDDPNHIDLLPSIAALLEVEAPSQCEGVAWGDHDSQRPRIVERISTDWYNVSVEIEGTKGIFRYPSNFPQRPTVKQVELGLIHFEYYSLDVVRDGDYESRADDIDQTTADRLRESAEEFIQETERQEWADEAITSPQPASDVDERLRELGYR